jgi:lambda family phage portal protein
MIALEAPKLSQSFRQAFGELKNDYAAGTNTRYRPAPRGVQISGSGADYHYRSETKFLRAIERSRFFDRDNMVVGQGVNRLCANVVQDGFTLDVRTGNKSIDKELSERWSEWANDPEACDYEGEKTFRKMESLVLRSVIVDGDVLALPLRDFGSLQMVEAHRLRTPSNTRKNVVHGVEMADSARRERYWITKEDLDPILSLSRVSDVKQVEARDELGNRQVFHVYLPTRFSQRRGVTAFAPVVDAIGMHDDLQFATLVKAQVASCFAIFEELDIAIGAGGAKPGTIRTGSQTTEANADGTQRTVEGVAPGMRVTGSPGVKLTGFSPNIPNPEFFPHATLILTFIAVNLDLPVAVLLLDPSNTNFSGWRGAIDQARMRFRTIQADLREGFHTPVYKWKVRQWMEESDRLRSAFLKLGEKMFWHRWNPPTWRYIEPNKDAAADDLRTSRGLISRRRRAAEQGYDGEELDAEIIADNGALLELAIKEAARLRGKYPDYPVTFQQILQPYGATPVTVPDADQLESQSQRQKQGASSVA